MKPHPFWRSILLVSWLVLAGLATHAQVPDTALVIGLTGAAHYRAGEAAPQPLQPFLRLRLGETVELAADARLSLAYLGSGAVESWAGPAQLKVGDNGSAALRGTAPQIQLLPRTLLDRLARAPEVLADLRNRQGLVVTREIGKPEPMAVQQARADLEAVQSGGAGAGASPQGLPDLNLFLALYESRQYREADKVIEDLARRQPEDPMVAGLAREFQRIYRKPAPAP